MDYEIIEKILCGQTVALIISSELELVVLINAQPPFGNSLFQEALPPLPTDSEERLKDALEAIDFG